jgi:hypothetical protein
MMNFNANSRTSNGSLPAQTSRLTPDSRLRAAKLIEEKKLRLAEKSAFYWLTNCTQTVDEQDKVNPFKPFPADIYVRELIKVLLREPITLVPKSRSMMASWTIAGAACHTCQVHPATAVVVQSRDEDRSKKIVEYVKILYERSMPAWKARHPLARPMNQQAEIICEWENHSWVKAITGNPNKIRSEHPTIVCFDEAAFMDEFDECFNVAAGAKPLHVWAISSAAPGPFFDIFETASPVDYPYLEQ